jgi:Glycosyl hydrolases family 18
MPEQTFIAYWSGEEPTGPKLSPTLAEIPDAVDIVVLFYATIVEGDLNFDNLTRHNDKATIKRWMDEIRARQRPSRTKFLLCINDQCFNKQKPEDFAHKVAVAAESWGVDGIDIDYEPPSADPSIIPVVEAIRAALPAHFLMSAPIYFQWLDVDIKQLLRPYAAVFNYMMTMDYTPYPGYEPMISLYKQYSEAMGGESAYGKLAIGVSCMDFGGQYGEDFTPLADVTKFCQYKPDGKNKLGIMLFSLSYDAPGHPNGSYPFPSRFEYARTVEKDLL